MILMGGGRGEVMVADIREAVKASSSSAKVRGGMTVPGREVHGVSVLLEGPPEAWLLMRTSSRPTELFWSRSVRLLLRELLTVTDSTDLRCCARSAEFVCDEPCVPSLGASGD